MKKACFWKFCSWKSYRKNENLKRILVEIYQVKDNIEKENERFNLKKTNLTQNGKAENLKKDDREKLKKLNDVAYLFSRFY